MPAPCFFSVRWLRSGQGRLLVCSLSSLGAPCRRYLALRARWAGAVPCALRTREQASPDSAGVLLVALVHSVVVVGIVAGMALGILAGVRHLRLFRVACVGACFSFEVALDVLLGSRSVRI